ncbi:hypothetical protein EC973_008540 [Apophysomyces ossiformis]|uniref:HCP-like protein n=1 Tax=Apophysomyces ossiformis TaxID=679940 RepID=A0A8H7ETL7_9FUNG|nr:hypothetical protein EC973_008540 [Apophysomyces ossiformis]
MGTQHSRLKRKQKKIPPHPSTPVRCPPQPKTSPCIPLLPQQRPILRDRAPTEENQNRNTRIEDYSKDISDNVLSNCTQSISDILPAYIPVTFQPGIGCTRFSSCSSSVTDPTSSAVSLTSALFSIDSTTAPSSLSSLSSVSFQSKYSLPFVHNSPSNTHTLLDETKQKIYTALVNDADSTNDLRLRLKIAQCKIQGFGTPVDLDEAFHELIHLARQLTGADLVQISYFLGFCYYSGKTPSGKVDPQNAYTWFERAATQHEPVDLVSNAQYLAATLIAHKKVALDFSKALSLFEKAANHGHVIAQHVMGWQAERQDDHLAREWYHHAAQQNYAPAQADLGDWLLRHHADLKEHVEEAIFWLQRAAEQNNAKAHLLLASLYGEGKLVDKDCKQAQAHYHRITIDPSHPNHPTIHYAAAIAFRNGSHGLSQDFERAVQHLTVAAKANFPPAQRTLGTMYYQGQGVVKDVTLAHELFRQAALQNDPRALGFLGELLQHGIGCTVDIETALEYYEKAFHCGDVVSALSKGLLLHHTSQHHEALQWFKRVVQCDTRSLEFDFMRAHQKARLMIALYRSWGWGGVLCDPLQAFSDLKALAKEGFSEAFYWVGSGYTEGIVRQGRVVVSPNPSLGFEYFEKAAIQGISFAQYKVATILATGTVSGNKDPKNAFIHYKNAADQGHPKAQYSVGLYYFKGISPVEVDLKEAQRWFRASLEDNDDMAVVSDALLNLAQLVMDNEPQEAFKYLTKAVELGNVAGLRGLAVIYEKQGATESYATAFRLLSEAIRQKDARSWVAMAKYYENGWSVPQSIEQARACLTEAEKLGYARASIAIAELYERQKEWDDALQKYNKVALKEPFASKVGWLARLGKCRLVIYRNKGTEQDRVQVYQWLQEMAAKNSQEESVEPLTMLGIYYQTTVNDASEEAIRCYNKAINCTTTSTHWPQENARFRLARLCVEKGKHKEALGYFTQLHPLLESMNHHSRETMIQARQIRYYTGYLLLHGKGVLHDVEEAKRFLLHAAEEGEGDAAYELGVLLANEDEEEAIQMLRQGRSVNHAGCIRELALILQRRRRDEEDWTGENVYELLEEASELGDIEALFHLGMSNQYGLGTFIQGGNLRSAIGYYTDAALRGHSQAALYCGQVHHLLGQFHEAAEWFLKVPDNRTALMRLAAYRLNGSGGLEQDERAAFLELERLYGQEKDNKLLAELLILTGQCLERGQGTPQNKAAAKDRYLRAAGLTNTDAMFRLGILCEEEKDMAGAFHWYSLAATTDHHVESQYRMGLCHWQALVDQERNPIAAKRYFGKAAEQGHARAKFELGNVLWYLEEYDQALASYYDAAELNVPEAFCGLGKLYYSGFHSNDFVIHKDLQKAFEYFLKATQIPGHDGIADFMVGTYYTEGYCEHIKPSAREALAWYLRAHELGVSFAQVFIGKLKHMMADDIDDSQQAEDLRAEAYGWFASAQDNDIHAQVMVALYHLNGWGRVARDERLGFRRLLSIAKEGHTEAYTDIALCFEKGIGVDQNYQDALAYWMLASQVDEDAEVLDRVGYYHEHGLGGLKADKDEAKKYYESANLIRNRNVSKDHSIVSTSSSASSY